ncbi:hypothetical protein BJX68DRAFT_258711 [Aspergillus pseudodeflectus]|uniref:Uncharacterized protein n=1 Tax=Aspergillus pseudodeflectus TaxID=176178 RepID=A0ABR4JIK4_9EURO
MKKVRPRYRILIPFAFFIIISPPTDFKIPPEFQDQLELAGSLDPGANEEIVQALTTCKRPVTGFNAMPGWCQRNVIDWHRVCGPSLSIRLLELLLHKAMVDGIMDDPYSGQHSADFVRCAALILHGGVFMDVSIILRRSLDRLCRSKLDDPSSPFQICVPLIRKADPFITRWHQLVLHGMCHSPLFEFAMNLLDYSALAEMGYNWDWDVQPPRRINYARNNILWTDVLSENWGFEKEIGFVGQDPYDLLATRRDADPNSEEYKKAHRLVWDFLSQCSMQKSTHSKNLIKKPAPGVLWDHYDGKDIEPGTFAELFRDGTVHFRQTREAIRFVEPEFPEQTMLKGVLEP